MKCPICKKTIPDNALKCPYCKTRTGLVCKNCNTVNTIFDLVCKNCGQEILKICPQCKSVNFPNAENYRKCNYKFQTKEEPSANKQPNLFEFATQNLVAQQSAKNILVKNILSDDKKIFSLSGPKGTGKTLVISHIINELKEKNYVWFYGSCTPITQLTPGGLLQDIILNLFNLPNFCINNNKFRKDATKYFQNEFPYLEPQEVGDLLNFLYPTKNGTFETMLAGKTRHFELLTKIFEKIIQYSRFVIVVNNFEYIDGYSYEFLNNFIKKDNVFGDLKLLIVYNEHKPAKGFFYFPENKADGIFTDVYLAPLDAKQMFAFADVKEGEEDFPKLDDTTKRKIFLQSNGNPAYLEQTLELFKEETSKIRHNAFVIPQTYTDVVSRRLAILKDKNLRAYMTLMGCAMIGDKINLNLIKQIFQYRDDDFSDVIAYLQQRNFIEPMNDIYYRFKSLYLWETIVKAVKTDDRYEEINKKIFLAVANFTMNSTAILGIIAQNLKHPKLALDIWTKNTRLASFIGDTNLYAISQKQCLALINELDDTETLKIRYNICERLGKLLADFNPKEAMDYLPDAIMNAKNMGDSPREIELLGYMASCCRKTGNYFGEVECTDAVLEKMNPDDKLELALVRSTKLNALLNIGNCGQIINLIDNDIMPAFDDFLSKNEPHPTIPMDIIFETWIKTYLVLANALIIQGNNRSFEILTILFDVLERNRIEDENLICKSQLALAFANTMKGDIPESEKILEEIQKEYQSKSMDNECVTRWNFINIINNFFRKRYNGLQEDLFQIVTFANNNGDNFTKNMLKAMLGIIFQENEQTNQAIEIYNDQIAYFSKEKMALGALLTWYLIADATIITEGPQQALDIASQALEVAQNPKINNHFFACLLQSVMAKATLALSDFESTKIHLENAIITARQYGLNDLISRLYLQYGRYFQELGLIKSNRQKDYLIAAAKMYEKASEIVKATRNNCVHQDIQKAKAVLKTFCHLNKIPIELKK